MLARHEEHAAGFEEPDLFLLGDEAGELDVLGQAARGDLRRERIADIADEHGAEVRQALREQLQRAQQVIDAFLAMDAPDPDGVVDAFLFRHGVGGADFESVGNERAFVRADAELVQAPLHERVEVEEVVACSFRSRRGDEALIFLRR